MDVLPTGRGDSVGQEQTIEQPEADNQCAGLRHLLWEQQQQRQQMNTNVVLKPTASNLYTEKGGGAHVTGISFNENLSPTFPKSEQIQAVRLTHAAPGDKELQALLRSKHRELGLPAFSLKGTCHKSN